MKIPGVPSTPLRSPLRRPEQAGIPPEFAVAQRGLATEQEVVHLPELSLDVRGLRRQRRVEGMRMGFCEGEIAKREDQGIAKILPDCCNADERLASVRTLVVAVDDEA
jgi:hypothetical protein